MQELNLPEMEAVPGPADVVSNLSGRHGQWSLNKHSPAATVASSNAKVARTQDNVDPLPSHIHRGLDSAHCPELACSQNPKFEHFTMATPAGITPPTRAETASAPQLAESARLSSAHHQHGGLLHQSRIGQAASLIHPNAATEAAEEVSPRTLTSTPPLCFANKIWITKPAASQQRRAEQHHEGSEHHWQRASTNTLTSRGPDQSTQNSPALRMPAVQSQDNLVRKTPEQNFTSVPMAPLHDPPTFPATPSTTIPLRNPDLAPPHSDKAAPARETEPAATSTNDSSPSIAKGHDQPDVVYHHPSNHSEAAPAARPEPAVLESSPTSTVTEVTEVHSAGSRAPSEPAQLDFAAFASYLAATQQQREAMLQSPKLQRAMAPAEAASGDVNAAQLSDSPFSGILC